MNRQVNPIKQFVETSLHYKRRSWQKLNSWFRLRNILFDSIGYNTYISSRAAIDCPSMMNIGDNVFLADFCSLTCKGGWIDIGDRTQIMEYARVLSVTGLIRIGQDCTLQNFSMVSGYTGGVEIGNGVRIGAHSLIIGSNHDFSTRELPIWKQGSSSDGICIEDDVWIGSNVTILDGVILGTGSVIAAGSVVTKNVPEYSVVAGVPARILRTR